MRQGIKVSNTDVSNIWSLDLQDFFLNEETNYFYILNPIL